MKLYYLLDKMHADYESLVARMRSDHESRGIEFFSNPESFSGLQSFALVQGAQEGDYASDCIIAVYDENTHALSPPALRTGEWEEPEDDPEP